MTGFLTVAVNLCLLMYFLAVLLAAWRLLSGPAAQDRILALDFIYVVAMLAVLALGIRNNSNVYFVAALLIAVTGFVSSSAMAKFLLRGEVIE